ncbi:MAG: hypothetical protein HMLIMOIP_000899 [Candidatus Nitrosomirales archaeon]|jgi:hypothetical protein
MLVKCEHFIARVRGTWAVSNRNMQEWKVSPVIVVIRLIGALLRSLHLANRDVRRFAVILIEGLT